MPILYIFFKICGGRVVKMRQNIPFWPPVMLCHCAVAWGCRLPREGGQRCVEVSIFLGNVWQVRRDFWGLKWTRSMHFQGKWGNRDRMFRGRNLEGMSASGQGIHPRERPGWAEKHHQLLASTYKSSARHHACQQRVNHVGLGHKTHQNKN